MGEFDDSIAGAGSDVRSVAEGRVFRFATNICPLVGVIVPNRSFESAVLSDCSGFP